MSMYYLTEGDDPRIRYIGITNNPKRREAEHKRRRGDSYTMTVIRTGMTRAEARIAEAIAIEAYTLEVLENKRREISPAKRKEWDEILASVWDFQDLTTDYIGR